MNPLHPLASCCWRLALLAVLAAALVKGSFAADPPPSLFAGLPPVAPDAAQSLTADRADWYKDAIVYHLWVPAFRDSNADGIGDLPGIIQGLDTLRDLGVNTLWLSPFFESGSSLRNLHGYDVINHYRVDPRLGSNDDADELIRAAHAKGLRLIFDLVPNHVSSRHPWFLESSDPQSPKRDWFIWRDQQPAEGWTGFDRRSDWHAFAGAYYYGIFSRGMPDLNHRNPAVRLELARAARYWLDRGFDGMRMDAVRYLYENLDGDGAKADQEDQPGTIAWFEAWRREVMDPYTGLGYAKFMVAENWNTDRDRLLDFLRHEERPTFHMTLNFPLLPALTGLDAAAARDMWEWDATLPADAWLGNFASNHDMAADRPGTLFAGQPEKLRAQSAWLLLGPGTPFIYNGNEIGQPQGPQRGDTRHRQPLDWEELTRQRADPDSLWHQNRQLIQLRRAHASLRRGKAQFWETTAGTNVLALWREAEGDRTLTILGSQPEPLSALTVKLPAGLTGQPGRWLLGSGPAPVKSDGTVALGPLVPFESKVLLWGE